VLRRLVIATLLFAGEGAAFAQPLEVHATCAANLPRDPAHLRTLREELARALRDVGPSRRYTLDVSLVQLRTKTIGRELEVHLELRAILSDEHRRVLSMSSSSATARGSLKDKELVQREAFASASERVARRVLMHVDNEPRVANK
jgi:hypothetical protein